MHRPRRSDRVASRSASRIARPAASIARRRECLEQCPTLSRHVRFAGVLRRLGDDRDQSYRTSRPGLPRRDGHRSACSDCGPRHRLREAGPPSVAPSGSVKVWVPPSGRRQGDLSAFLHGRRPCSFFSSSISGAKDWLPFASLSPIIPNPGRMARWLRRHQQSFNPPGTPTGSACTHRGRRHRLSWRRPSRRRGWPAPSSTSIGRRTSSTIRPISSRPGSACRRRRRRRGWYARTG